MVLKSLPRVGYIELRKKEDRLPVELADCDEVVFDGYCNPIERP